MRISRLFATAMLSVTVFAVILGAEVLAPQTESVLSKREAIRDVEAFGAVLLVSQQVVGHRAPYLRPLFQDGPATPVQLEEIAKAVQASDIAFAKATAVLGNMIHGAEILDGIDPAATKIA